MKSGALLNRRAAGHGFGDDAARLDLEAGGLDLAYLVFGGLADRADTDVGERAGHPAFPVHNRCSFLAPRTQAVKLYSEQVIATWP